MGVAIHTFVVVSPFHDEILAVESTLERAKQKAFVFSREYADDAQSDNDTTVCIYQLVGVATMTKKYVETFTDAKTTGSKKV